ncbi:MAG: sensor histidine kinase [Anaerolineales bacterium]
MPPNLPNQRPPWWPENETWPPRRGPWQRGRGRWWRWLWVPVLMFFLTIGGCTLAFWFALLGLGWIDAPGGFGPDGPHMPWMMFSGWWRVVGVFVSIMIVAGLATLLFSGLRRVAVPVRDLMEAAGRVEAGDYAVRVREAGPRDVRDLARAFNAMAARLQVNEDQRRKLLADVTHELRTPLAVVQGNLEALMDGVYPADDAHLGPLLEETQVLARLIDDLRTLSLAESGVLKLQREPTDLGILVTETAASFRAQAGAAGVGLHLQLADDLPLIEIDPVRIREVLSNLIANALRYTPVGGAVTVEARPVRSIEISVSDTGRGISAEMLPHIFDRFYKSEESRGSGLGLAIAKNLVAAHGGEIVAESEPGKGTTIRFTLPHHDPASR